MTDADLLDSVISYPLSIVNILVSAGLIHVYLYPKKYTGWKSGVKASLPVAIFFFVSNVYLTVTPFIPPAEGAKRIYESLPYYIHCIAGLCVFVAGAIYWALWARFFPWLGGYRLVQETVIGEDGWSRTVINKVPVAKTVKSEAITDPWPLIAVKKWWQSG